MLPRPPMLPPELLDGPAVPPELALAVFPAAELGEYGPNTSPDWTRT